MGAFKQIKQVAGVRHISKSKQVREYLLIILGLLIYTLGWTLFLIPQKITGGGASGMGALVYYLTGFPVGYSFLIINVVLIAIAMKIIGANFGVKTIVAVVLASAFLAVEQMLQQMYIPNGLLPGEENKLLSTILGGVFSGLGIGMAFSAGGSTGGTDIIAMIINKYRNVSPGKAILLADALIITSAFFVLRDQIFEQRLESIVFGFVVMGVTGYTIDAYLSGLKQSMQAMVFSKKYEAIADRITNEMGRGATILEGKGWYSKESQKILMVVVRKNEIGDLYRIVKEVDDEAFTSVASVMGVFGKGFDQIRH